MNIDIPQPTVLERLRKDLGFAQTRLRIMEIDEITCSREDILFQRGLVQGLEWAVRNLELNQ